MTGQLTPVDPEVAAAAFRGDLDRLWDGERPSERSWKRNDLDELTSIIEMPGRLASGEVHPHLVKLEGHYYPTHPPRALFVEPETWAEAPEDSPWFPKTDPAGGGPTGQWFGIHATYQYPEGPPRQLICFSQSLDYYLSGHAPTSTEIWTPGKHKVAATLNRIDEILSPVYYRGPGAASEQAVAA